MGIDGDQTFFGRDYRPRENLEYLMQQHLEKWRSEVIRRLRQKPDISRWSFPQLRDEINRSCYVEFLKSCQQEIINCEIINSKTDMPHKSTSAEPPDHSALNLIGSEEEAEIIDKCYQEYIQSHRPCSDDNERPSSNQYDLSKRRYSDLVEDALIVDDVELMEVYHHEVIRRVEVYHRWIMEENKKDLMKNQDIGIEVGSLRSPTIPKTRSENVASAEDHDLKYNVSEWKYSEILNAINNSCDMELVEACYLESNRRNQMYDEMSIDKCYHECLRKYRYSTGDCSQSYPKWDLTKWSYAQLIDADFCNMELLEACHIESLLRVCVYALWVDDNCPYLLQDSSHRYFRVPFYRNNDISQKAWSYVHFDGSHVVRQMEVYSDKPSILLEAGIDDDYMSQLTLEETGLARRPGTEILQHEFNMEWEKNGGKPYGYSC